MHRLVFATFFALAGAAFAEKVEMQVNLNKAEFEATRARLVEQLGSDRYSEITPVDKSAVVSALDRIDARLAKADKLSEQDRVDIFNDQELINQITTHAAADSRLFCERDAPTGSHHVQVICLTMKTWMEREQTGQTEMFAVDHNHNIKCPACAD
jgi:predicted DNA-binding protein (UPF0251 family)